MGDLLKHASLTDESGDDVVHALQEAGEMLSGRVVRGSDLGHDGRCLGSGRLHAAVVSQDVCQAQDPVHLQDGHTAGSHVTTLLYCFKSVSFNSII